VSTLSVHTWHLSLSSLRQQQKKQRRKYSNHSTPNTMSLCVSACVHTSACLGFHTASAFSILGVWPMQTASQLQPPPLPSHQHAEETYTVPVQWLLTCLPPTHPPLSLVVDRGLVFHSDIHQQDGKKNEISFTFP